ncbi:MAG: hypothetical protein Q8L87_10050 [Anaerolineales bacterium]|nr:hypothetical protein [Anaerolineales bacterium]
MIRKLLAGILVVLGLILSACSTGTETQSATDVPTEMETVVVTAPESGECLACHTDKQLLIDTARPEELDHEAESKGVG